MSCVNGPLMDLEWLSFLEISFKKETK